MTQIFLFPFVPEQWRRQKEGGGGGGQLNQSKGSSTHKAPIPVGVGRFLCMQPYPCK